MQETGNDTDGSVNAQGKASVPKVEWTNDWTNRDLENFCLWLKLCTLDNTSQTNKGTFWNMLNQICYLRKCFVKNDIWLFIVYYGKDLDGNSS